MKPNQSAAPSRAARVAGGLLLLAALLGRGAGAFGAEPGEGWIGYTELRTDLPGGRHANVRASRAVVARLDGTGRRELASALADGPDAWTQFAGWSPDGRSAVVVRGWQDPANAQWEEERKQFRMEPGKWELDSCLVDFASGKWTNLTAVERVSHYNGGLFFLPGGGGLGFTPLIGGLSTPHLMDLDGRNKRRVSGGGSGFAYGFSASPDGKRVAYHEDYQIVVSNADGTERRKLDTGRPFNFGPSWSPDGEWLLFVSGERGRSDPWVARKDGSEMRKLADLNGYQGWILFLDVPDFHEGSSDLPVWSTDGKSVFYTAKRGGNVELFQVDLEGSPTQLTRSPPGSLHYHPKPSQDGEYLMYGSKREGVRQLFVMRLADRRESQITRLERGRAAMWAHWRPMPTP